MPSRRSAGILLFRRVAAEPGPHEPAVQVLIGHMGGPLWARKDDAAWSIPKGEHGEDEEPFAAARREFHEEMGSPAPDVAYLDLGTVRQSGGKTVAVWAGEADFDADAARSVTFEMPWPPRSGRVQSFPEIDRAQWLGLDAAAPKLIVGQRVFLDRLRTALGLTSEPSPAPPPMAAG